MDLYDYRQQRRAHFAAGIEIANRAREWGCWLAIPMNRDLLAYLLSFGLGLLLWGASAQLGHNREPWDSALYWQASYPLAILLSAALGFAFPTRPWRWALVLMFGQALVMIATGSGLSLFPLGLAVLLLLSLPPAAASEIAGRIRS